MKYHYLIVFAVFLALLLRCSTDEPAGSNAAGTTEDRLGTTAESIIQTAIERNGLAGFDSTAISFRFRDKRYRYQRLNGQFAYERWWVDSLSGARVRDVLTNDGLIRYVDGQIAEITDKKRQAYANSVNSVIYFSFMPWALADPSVNAEYTGVDTIRGEPLLHLTIGFQHGDDHNHEPDDYEYWFEPDSYEIRYLAYAHPSGRAPRFREAYNSREVAGFRVRDYRNYTTHDQSDLVVDQLANRFNAGELVVLSLIEHDQYRREPINERQRPMSSEWWKELALSQTCFQRKSLSQ